MSINPGDKFGKWTVIESQKYQQPKKLVIKWLCKCDCGNTKLVAGYDLKKQKSTQCSSCYGTFQKNLIGQVFGKWKVLDWAPKQFKRTYYKCQCECGSTHDVAQQTLLNKTSVQCLGCSIENPGALKHGFLRKDNKHPLYSIWITIIARCKNPNNHSYKDYGARGITICDRWLDLNAFCKDMGERPSQFHSIDRIDNNKGYCPENCRWATQIVQANNRRTNVFYEKNGIILSKKEWANKLKTTVIALQKLVERKGFDHAYDYYTNIGYKPNSRSKL